MMRSSGCEEGKADSAGRGLAPDAALPGVVRFEALTEPGAPTLLRAIGVRKLPALLLLLLLAVLRPDPALLRPLPGRLGTLLPLPCCLTAFGEALRGLAEDFGEGLRVAFEADGGGRFGAVMAVTARARPKPGGETIFRFLRAL